MSFVVGCIIGVLIFILGWECAHSTVAKECERLGGFYVGNKIYKCVMVKSGSVLSGQDRTQGMQQSNHDIEEEK